MAKFLDVFLGESKVGLLEQDDFGAMTFCYDADCLADDDSMPLSVSLPLQAERFKTKECRPFFAGVLPEERSRAAVAGKFGVSERNDFALLEKIGAECAGAVSLLPPGQKPMGLKASYRKISKAQLEEKLRGLPVSPLMAGEEGVRLSLAGAQGKAALKIEDGFYYLPIDGSPSTHILKPESEHFDRLVENEFFCMNLAGAVGLDVAEASIANVGDLSFLEVLRYDRYKLEFGEFGRIHQEDFCQALGVPPEFKYQGEGGPGLEECFALVRRVSTAPAFDVLKLFDAVVFNYLIGNNDAHGKNFSLIYLEGETKLAPLYDLVCTAAYPGLSQDMAMKLGGVKEADRLYSKDWLEFFQNAELGPAMAIQRVRSLTKKTDQAVMEISSNRSKFDDIAKFVRDRCESVMLLDWKRS